MKSFLHFAALALLLQGSLHAAVKPGSVGLGLQVGTLTGVNMKFWMSKETAIEGAVGSAGLNGIVAEGAFLWHRYNAFHSERDKLEDNLPLIFGVGGLFSTTPAPYGPGTGLAAVKGVVGISYLFDPEPFDL